VPPVRWPDADGKDRDDVGVWRYRDVYHQHVGAVQAAPQRVEHGAYVPRAAVSVLPAFALVAPVICLATMVCFNFLLAIVFAIFLAPGYVYFLLTRYRRDAVATDALLEE
jgi:hypothetical protein